MPPATRPGELAVYAVSLASGMGPPRCRDPRDHLGVDVMVIGSPRRDNQDTPVAAGWRVWPGRWRRRWDSPSSQPDVHHDNRPPSDRKGDLTGTGRPGWGRLAEPTHYHPRPDQPRPTLTRWRNRPGEGASVGSIACSARSTSHSPAPVAEGAGLLRVANALDGAVVRDPGHVVERRRRPTLRAAHGPTIDGGFWSGPTTRCRPVVAALADVDRVHAPVGASWRPHPALGAQGGGGGAHHFTDQVRQMSRAGGGRP